MIMLIFMLAYACEHYAKFMSAEFPHRLKTRFPNACSGWVGVTWFLISHWCPPINRWADLGVGGGGGGGGFLKLASKIPPREGTRQTPPPHPSLLLLPLLPFHSSASPQINLDEFTPKEKPWSFNNKNLKV